MFRGSLGFSGDGGAAVEAQFAYPSSVAVDRAGNIYIADQNNARIRRVDTAGVITTVAGGGVEGFSGDGGAAVEAQLVNPEGVAVDGAGNIYIEGYDRIRKVDAAGRISTVVELGRGYGGPAVIGAERPGGVALDGAGNIYIADQWNNRIRKVNAAGVITTVAGGGSSLGDGVPAVEARLNHPTGVALDGSGNLYIADTQNDRVRKVTFSPLASPEPTVEPVEASELSFEPAPAADPSAPMSQTLTLHAEGGAVDFQALPSARWIEVSLPSGGASWRGRLADGETITLRVTVNPAGLRPGTHRGRLYIRSGGRLTARVNIVLEVPPPTGPDVSESGGVLNAARMSAYGERGLFGPQLLPVSPGSLVVVQGVNFLSGERMAAEGFPLPTSLGGTRVLFDGEAVPLFSVGPRRIEAQLPWALGMERLAAGGLSLAEVVVEAADGESSYPRRFWVGPSAPGVFTAEGAGQGQALALFAGTTALAAPSGFAEGSRPARAGDVLEIYATGLGVVEPAPPADGMNSCPPDGVCLADGSNAGLRRTTAQPQVWIGAYPLAPENILFSGLAPSMVGMYLVVAEAPGNVPPSAAAELRLIVAGRSSQYGATIAVE